MPASVLISAPNARLVGAAAAPRRSAAAARPRPSVVCAYAQDTTTYAYGEEPWRSREWGSPGPADSHSNDFYGQQNGSTHEDDGYAYAEEEEQEEAYADQQQYGYANGHSNGSTNHDEQQPASGREAVQNALANNPLFNAKFVGVLQDSLARQGASALTSAPPVEPRISATEEVLTVALQHSKQSLHQLLVWREQLERHIAVQQKQVDRMEFALNKSRNDAAYMRAVKEMMHNDM